MTASSRTFPPFPGSVGLTSLQVYDWDSEDGRHGGAPHMHLTCTECYVVTSGHGLLQTLTRDGFAESELSPGDVVWFTPGTVHRSVTTDGALQVLVVMENGGLPEAGDAVITFPPEHLADQESYARASALAGPDGTPSEERARTRRDLALAGFATLRARTEAGDPSALTAFHAAASRLVRPRLEEWRSLWQDGALASATRTSDQISALENGDPTHLDDAMVSRITSRGHPSLGMCGFLRAYDPVRLAGRD